MPRTLTDIERELYSFESSRDMAEHFRREGIRGEFGCSDSAGNTDPMRDCPIARYIQRETDDPSLSAHDITVHDGSVVDRFMMDYDSRLYPFLIRGRES